MPRGKRTAIPQPPTPLVRTRRAGTKKRRVDQQVDPAPNPNRTMPPLDPPQQAEDGSTTNSDVTFQDLPGEHNFPGISFPRNVQQIDREIAFSSPFNSTPNEGSAPTIITHDVNPQQFLLAADCLGLLIPQITRDRIHNSEYIDLGLLLKGVNGEPDNQAVGLMGVNSQGQLEMFRKKTQSIQNIDNWTTAFITFTSIYLERYPEKAQQMLKYMSNIRLAAKRASGFGWRFYDEQFRLRLARFPDTPWSSINQDLWLTCVVSTAQSVALPTTRVQATETPGSTATMTSTFP